MGSYIEEREDEPMSRINQVISRARCSGCQESMTQVLYRRGKPFTEFLERVKTARAGWEITRSGRQFCPTCAAVRGLETMIALTDPLPVPSLREMRLVRRRQLSYWIGHWAGKLERWF